MKVILVVTDSKRKNLVFSTNALKAYSLDESVKLAREGKLESVHVVQTGQGAYLRANPNTVEDDNLDSRSISANHLYLSYGFAFETPSILGVPLHIFLIPKPNATPLFMSF